MKTIREWIDLCADDTIREKWLRNHLNNPHRHSNGNAENMSHALVKMTNFDWLHSPEGYEYWRYIYDDMERNPNKYLRKRKQMFHEYEDN